MSKAAISQYIAELNSKYKTGITAEHSFRGDLCLLLENLTNYQVINEAKHIACGAPDLTILHKNIPIGYVEAKDIGKNLNDKNYNEQFTRYKKALDNLIITDYLNFQYFRGEELVTEIAIAKEQTGKIEPLTDNFNAFAEMIKDFSLYNGKAINNSQKLAEYMAAKTQLLAEVIEKTIADKDENNSLRQQLKGFQQVLLPTMTDTQFADIYAQTIAYGMFVARLQDFSNDNFTRRHAATLIPQSNPFLRNLFQYIAGFDLDQNIRWIVDSLADMFNFVDIDAIHKEFISKDKDPFLHFYEDFLTKYDKNLKTARGAYYTPLAVVKFIVNAVDDILKTDFNISKGLADNSKIEINNQAYHKVQILDPTTGTGTFLAEVVRKIYKSFENNAGIWNDYVKNHLIPRLNGFEIMMSPYTMAHLKLEMILQELGANDNTDRLHIYLTDALADPKQTIHQIPFAQWLSNEANEAAKIKNDVPVMVVLGNPPYSGESQNKSTNKKKKLWIEEKLDIYKLDDKGMKIPNTKWLNNDYVKFIRFGQHFIHKNKNGILAFITDNSFLDSLSFKGMRYNLLKEFDKIYILNLHGNSLKNETTPEGNKDENVFDIMQGVSINIFVKTGNNKGINPLAKVLYADLYGKREVKYSELLENSIQKINWQELIFNDDNYFFVPKDFSLREEYEEGFKIDELFYLNGVGICSKRDKTAFQNTKNELINVLNDFKTLSEQELKQKYKTEKKESRDKKTIYAKQNILSFGTDDKFLKSISYRPFETKWTYFTNKSKGFVAFPVYNLMQHFTKGENIGLVISKKSRQLSLGYFFITNKITDLHILDSVADATYVFPLYHYQDKFGKIEKTLNLNTDILFDIQYNFIQEEIGKGGQYVDSSGREIDIYFEPENLIDYIYAVLHSPTYREKYKEFLKIDFPRVPFPENAEQFFQLAALGEQLRKLHLLENITVPKNFANYPVSGSDLIEKPSLTPCPSPKEGSGEVCRVWINNTQYFDNIPQVAWNFYIGGYLPAQKWLKDRKGRKLNFDDTQHYQKIIFALAKTDKIMQEVDKIMEGEK